MVCLSCSGRKAEGTRDQVEEQGRAHDQGKVIKLSAAHIYLHVFCVHAHNVVYRDCAM